VVASVDLTDRGFELSGIAWLRPDAEGPYQPAKGAGDVVEKLPQDTLMVVAGGNLKQLWDSLDQRASQGIKGPLNPQTIRNGLQTFAGLDIDTDMIRWMTGGYALALVSAPETSEASPTAGVVLMAESSDRPGAEKTFAELDDAVQRRGFQVLPRSVSDIAVTDWAAPFGSLTLTRGWLENNTVFLTLGAVSEGLLPKPSTALPSNPQFQQVIGNDLSAHNGYFFVDVEAILQAKNTLPIPPLPTQQAATVGAIQAIGVTTDIQDAQTAGFTVTVEMQTLDGPGNLPEPGAAPAPSLEDNPQEDSAPDNNG